MMTWFVVSNMLFMFNPSMMTPNDSLTAFIRKVAKQTDWYFADGLRFPTGYDVDGVIWGLWTFDIIFLWDEHQVQSISVWR